MAAPDGSDTGTLSAIAEEAQRALQERPALSIRRRIGVGLTFLFMLGVGFTVVSVLIIERVETKLGVLDAVDHYAFEIQQARRYEKNFLLYRSDLPDALEQVRAARAILVQESASISTVMGTASVASMVARVSRYEALLSDLSGAVAAGGAASDASIDAVEAELREEGAEMVREAEELATRERESVHGMLAAARRINAGFLAVLLLVILLLAAFIARQMLAPLNRMVLATRRIAGGDLTPIMPRRRYNDEFSELAMAINHMLHELVRRQQALISAHKLKAIGTLTAGVAHELNNPINNIMITAAALQESEDGCAPEERREMVADLVHESERARDIVRNLLDFAREKDVELAPICVEELVSETLQLAGNEIRLAGVRVTGEVEEGVPPVHGDRQQLTQVFLNIVLNAVQAMPGGGALQIRVTRSPDATWLAVSFSDTGSGIAPHNLGRIFDPFFSSKRGRGTGLGLSVSLGIIKQHGGDISVESRPGEGATFIVSLPVAQVPAAIPVAVLAEV